MAAALQMTYTIPSASTQQLMLLLFSAHFPPSTAPIGCPLGPRCRGVGVAAALQQRGPCVAHAVPRVAARRRDVGVEGCGV